MVKLTQRQASAMTKPELKKWLTDRDQKLPKTDHNKSYYIERVLEFQSAHENDDSDVDMGPRGRSKSKRSTPSRLVNKRKTPIRNRRHSEMPSNNQTPTNQPIQTDARMTRSRRRTLDPGELHVGESVTRSRSRSRMSRKKKGLFLTKPAKDMKKVELQDWLSKNDIPFDSSMLKSGLIQLVMEHAMAPPDTPPKKARIERRPPAREGIPPVHRSPKRQLEDKRNPKAKRQRHSYRSDQMQGLLDSTDDEDDGDSKINDAEPPVTPKADGPLPPNLDPSPLTPQQPQNTVEKQGSSSPPMGTQSHNDSLLSTPALLRNVRRNGPKTITDIDRYQIRSEVREALDAVDEPVRPIESTYKRDRRRSSLEQKEDPPISRNLSFRDVGDSDAEEEKKDVVKTRLPDPPSEMIRHDWQPPKKKFHRRASEPVEVIPHQRIQFNPKTTGKGSEKVAKKKGSPTLNWILGAVVVGVLAFAVYVFFSLGTKIRFCDTNSDAIGGYTDGNGEPLPCEPCPDRASCVRGAALCDNQYILIGNKCVLDQKVVKAAYRVQAYVSSALAQQRGRHECGEDVEKGILENTLRRDMVTLFPSEEGTLPEDAFNYFRQNILPDISHIIREKSDGKWLFVSTRPKKTFDCLAKEWVNDNKLLVCSGTFLALVFLVMVARWRSSRRERAMIKDLKEQVMACLYERAHSNRPRKALSIDLLKNELKPPNDRVWNAVVEMMKYEHNVVKKEQMIQGVQRTCWEMTDAPISRRHRASLDPQTTSGWRPQPSHSQHPNMHSMPVPHAQMPSWQGSQYPNAPMGGNFGHGQLLTPQPEGLPQTGEPPANELFQRNRRQTEYNRQQEFTALQGDNEQQGQGFQFQTKFPPSSSGSNWGS